MQKRDVRVTVPKKTRTLSNRVLVFPTLAIPDTSENLQDEVADVVAALLKAHERLIRRQLR